MSPVTPLSGFLSHVAACFPELPGRRVAVALSGGADSVALLHLLGTPELAIDLTAIHVHHGVRGATADADAAFCAQLCDGLGIAMRQVELTSGGSDPEGREASWRRQRYAALHAAARELGAVAVATGHQLDDIAEGVLVQLLRGAGPRALAGIHAATGDGVVRPLLPWRHAELEAWLRANQLPWREDESNRSLRHLRNAVRHRVLPTLERHSPRLRRHLVRLAATLAADEAWFAAELARHAAWIDPWHPAGGVPVATIANLGAPLRARWLHAQLARCGIGRATHRQTELLDQLLDHGRPRSVNLAHRWRLRRVAERLWLEPPAAPQAIQRWLVPGDDLELGIPGWRLRFGSPTADRGSGSGWRWRPREPDQLRLRGVAPGDTVDDGGQRSRVAALLAESLPRHLRRAWPVVVANDTIVWIPGVWVHSEHAGGHELELEVART